MRARSHVDPYRGASPHRDAYSAISNAGPIVFQGRVAFALALESDPSVVTTVEGWDTYPAGTIFPNGPR